MDDLMFVRSIRTNAFKKTPNARRRDRVDLSFSSACQPFRGAGTYRLACRRTPIAFTACSIPREARKILMN